MSLKTKQQLVPKHLRYEKKGVTNTRKYLTIHQTANYEHGAGAQRHANLQSRGYTGAAWHWQVDDKIAIQSYPETSVAWHAGDGRNGPGNLNSLAIEMCVNPDSDYATALNNLVKLTAQIMKRNNIPMSRLVQHNYWTGKNCPKEIRQRGEWQSFRNKVQQLLGSAPTQTGRPAKLEEDGYWGANTTGGLQYINKHTQDRIVSRQPSVNRTPEFTTGWEWTKNASGGSLIIRVVQRYMAKKGHYKDKIDGWAGPNFRRGMILTYGGKNLREAIRNMQRAINRQMGY